MKWEFGEMHRSIFNKKMSIGMIISFVSLCYGSKDIMRFQTIGFLDTFIFSQTDSTTAIIALLFPIIAVLPVGTMYRSERQNGYYSLVRSKMSRMRYCRIKLVNAFLAGALVIGVPNFLFLIICFWVKRGMVGAESHIAVSFLSMLYFNKPMLYGMLLTGNAALCGGIFSLLELGVSAWIKNKYVAVIVPFGYYIFSAMVLFYISPWMNAIILFALNQYAEENIVIIIIYDLFLTVGGIILFIAGTYYEDFTV